MKMGLTRLAAAVQPRPQTELHWIARTVIVGGQEFGETSNVHLPEQQSSISLRHRSPERLAVEQQALAPIDRQLDRLVRYPEVAERLRLHRHETEQQIERLDDILRSLGESRSSLKDMALNFMGNMAALGHTLAPDEILKNSFVNHAFENFEIASYRSLITLAEAGSFSTAAMLLQTTLREEEAMAAWILEAIPDLTRKYVGLREQGRTASH